MNYPTDVKECLACGAKTWRNSESITSGWRAKAAAKKVWLERGPLDPYPNIIVSVVEHGGVFAIIEEELFDHGYFPEAGMVLTVAGRFWEVEGRIEDPKDSRTPPAWWVTPIDPEAWLAPLFEAHGTCWFK